MPKNEVCAVVEQVYHNIVDTIVACNKPGEGKNNKLYAPLVLLAQQQCDDILGEKNTKKSILEQILLCGKAVKKLGAGNCQLQSYAVFHDLLEQLISSGIIDYSACIPISIYMTSDHAFVVVDDLVCDPWAKFIGPIANSPYAKFTREEYFGIRANWQCYNGASQDAQSTDYTYALFPKPTYQTGFFVASPLSSESKAFIAPSSPSVSI
jgi:hypothetical protein